ncbi:MULTISPECIES: roadblock/LC7 domain-containing protein [unclassified Streptomyces]|uniref:Roadblock/LC7 domain-containing protein n=1 Tax=Streptomyces millisiae TaxID=3075542 RepID=A0ABU2LL14_9ACTN|nr:roadblock/LC7 domain-containing protein [Streptomyces sp. DSM 44918]MDT0318200.1 roadblock/LC7 domain-containing protein [Streptomyces sp. DSM 44918]
MNARTPVTRPKVDLSFVLTPILEIPNVQHAMVVTADGFFEAHSGLDGETAEKLSAVLASLLASSRGTSQTYFGGRSLLRLVMVETYEGYVFVIPAAENTYLAVFTGPNVAMDNVSYEMQKQVQTLGKAMGSPPRSDLGGSPVGGDGFPA